MKLIIDPLNRYFLGSDFAGLQMYNPNTNELSHFTRFNSLLPDDGIRSMTVDWDGNIWVATNGGICRINPDSKVIDIPHQVDYAINDISIGTDSTIWIAPSDGVPPAHRTRSCNVRIDENQVGEQ